MEERQDATLPAAWVGLEEDDNPTLLQGEWLSRHDVTPQSVQDDGPVLIMSSTSSGPAYDALLAHGQAGARVYVLVSEGWSLEANDAVLGCPKVLIRRLPTVPASGVYMASEAHVWMGATSGGATPWRLRLAPEQTSAFRQMFLRLFWHEAEEEAFTGSEQLHFRVAGARPFDVPPLTSAAPIRLVAPATLERAEVGGLAHQSAWAQQGELSNLWLAPSGQHHEELARLAKSGTQVQWRERALPDLALGASSGAALLPGAERRMRIELTPEQSADAKALLRQDGAWTFKVSVRLGDFASRDAKIWLKGADAPQCLEAEEIITLADVQADTLRGVQAATPSSWPRPQPLALTTRYTWTVLPPRLPRGASEAPLVGLWKKVDSDWKDRLSKAREALTETEQERGRIAKAFSVFKAMMGFERTQKALIKETTALDARLPSEAGLAEAAALFTRLLEAEEKTQTLAVDLRNEERSARDKEERERQEKAWRQRYTEAEKALPVSRKKLTDARASTTDIAQQLSVLDLEIESADKKDKRPLKARRSKLQEEQAGLKQLIERTTREVSSHEQVVSEAFIFTPPAQPSVRSKRSQGGRFVPTSSAPRPPTYIPDEELPKLGQLRVCERKRYLVIERWEELDLGEKEASRLNATLVAPEAV